MLSRFLPTPFSMIRRLAVACCLPLVLVACDASQSTNDAGANVPEEEFNDGIDVLAVIQQALPFVNFGGDTADDSDDGGQYEDAPLPPGVAPTRGQSAPTSTRVPPPVQAAPAGTAAVAIPINPGAGSFGARLGTGSDSGNQYSGDFSRFGAGPNVHLWRASLEVLSFMPMDLVDPVSGFIQTGFLASQANENDRLRVEVLVLSDQLREDALQITVIRQMRNPLSGQWTPAAVNPATATQLKARILQRAAQRQASAR